MNYIEMLLSMLGAGAGFSYFNQRGLSDITRVFGWVRSKLKRKHNQDEPLRKRERELEIELALVRAYRRELSEMTRQDVTVNGPWKRGWK